MSVYSTNQNRQLYVAVDFSGTFNGIKGNTNLGKVFVGSDADGNKFINQNGHGGIVRSDLINPANIMWATVSAPADTAIKLKAFEVDFAQEGVTITSPATSADTASATPVSGEDYILRVNFTQMYGISDEDIYQKYGAVHATASMSKNAFFRALAYSLVKNFSRLYQPLVEIAIGTAVGTATVIARAHKSTAGDIYLYGADGNAIAANNAENTKLYILEKSQVDEWSLGTKQYTPVYFKPFATTIFNGNDEVTWGKVTDVTTTYNQTVGNGYKYADLEHFCMGERGDQYRKIGWPNYIETKYFVVPTNTYYALDIHYAYQGTCEDIQKSEKTITILATSRSVIDSIITAMGIGSKVKATDTYNSIADNDVDYPTANEQAQIDALAQRVTILEG